MVLDLAAPAQKIEKIIKNIHTYILFNANPTKNWNMAASQSINFVCQLMLI